MDSGALEYVTHGEVSLGYGFQLAANIVVVFGAVGLSLEGDLLYEVVGWSHGREQAAIFLDCSESAETIF
jgi:hypothetical protein